MAVPLDFGIHPRERRIRRRAPAGAGVARKEGDVDAVGRVEPAGADLHHRLKTLISTENLETSHCKLSF